MASPLQNRNAESQPPARRGMCIPPRESPPPFTNARVPGRVVPIPQHIRPFLDRTHVPADGFVPKPIPEARDDANMAEHYYYKLCRLPPVRHPATNRVLSAYSGVELQADLRFSGYQFDEYIFHAARQGRLFMFRVEKQHTLLGYRYPHGHESTRCRFARCPIGGTIRSGQIRVCISEFSDPRNEILDPYQNAGYAHLYCLEKFCNLASLLAETNITFLPAVELAKEFTFPPALNIAERDACVRWAHEACQSWRQFKDFYPISESRPRYKTPVHGRLYYRLDQIREANSASKKRHDMPQVDNHGEKRHAPGSASRSLQALPPGTSMPGCVQRYGPQVFDVDPSFLYHSPPTKPHPQAHNNNLSIAAPLPPSSGPARPGFLEKIPTQPHVGGGAAPGPGADYSIDEIGALMAQDLVEYLESALEETPWQEPAAPPAADPQGGARPEQNTQPEQGLEPEQTAEPVPAPEPKQNSQRAATAKGPVLTAGRRRSRRSSAPAVLGARKARVRKSFKVSRRRSKIKGGH